MTTAPVRESPSARRTEDGPATAASIPGDGESLAHMTGTSATATEATTEKFDTFEAETAAIVERRRLWMQLHQRSRSNLHHPQRCQEWSEQLSDHGVPQWFLN